jgi:polyphosphate kinase 2
VEAMGTKDIIKRARGFSKPFRVTDANGFRLKNFDPSETLHLDSEDKPRAKEALAFGIEALAALQDKLYAQDRWAVLLVFQAMDAAGKDGTIKHIIEHLSPRETRVVALAKPSERDASAWYFQRYAPHLPLAQEMVLFNRSWYNRAGVERVMGFCSKDQYEEFMETVLPFEQMIQRSGIRLFKYYLDISKEEQKRRLKSRREDPLKQWKISPIDAVAPKHWKDYSAARNEMFARTHSPLSPWFVVRADDKHAARLNVIRHLLSQLSYEGKSKRVVRPDPEIVFAYDELYLENGMIAP